MGTVSLQVALEVTIAEAADTIFAACYGNEEIEITPIEREDVAQLITRPIGSVFKIDRAVIDRIIEEPLGGAHRDVDDMAERVKASLIEQVEQLGRLPVDQLIAARYQRLMTYGEFVEK